MSGNKPPKKPSGQSSRSPQTTSGLTRGKPSGRLTSGLSEYNSKTDKYRDSSRKSISNGNMSGSSKDQSKTYSSRQGNVSSTRTAGGQIPRTKQTKSTLSKFDFTFGGMLYIALTVIVAVVILGFTLWTITKKNAYEVYLNDKVIGVIQMSKKVSESAIYDTAVSKLASDVGANVKVNEMVTFKSKHASKKDFVTIEYVTGEIYKRFTYDIEASGISVNGDIVGYVKSKAVADSVLGSLKDQYIRPDSSTTAEFVDDIQVLPQFVPNEQVSEADVIRNVLLSTVDEQQTYKVKSGDTLWKIAQNAGMTIDQLLQINPALTSDSVLQINQELAIVRQKPLISVKTVEEVTYIDVERYQRETRQNYNEKKSYSKVIQQGKDGQKEVVAKITRINGFEIADGREIVSETVTVQPITEIVEVGVK